MPINGSFASLSKNGFNGGGNTSPPFLYWFGAVELKIEPAGGGAKHYIETKHFGNETWMYGGDYSASGTFPTTYYRPFAVKFAENTGLVSFYKVFDDQPNATANYSSIIGLEKDSLNNVYYLTDYLAGPTNCQLFKYDSTNTFVSGIDTGIGFPYSIVNMVIDSSNYLYIVSYWNNASGEIQIVKINSSTMSIVWTKTIPMVSTTYVACQKDNSDNLIIVTYKTSGTTSTIFKVDTSGSIVWQKSSTNSGQIAVDTGLYNGFGRNNRIAIDSNDNIFLLGGTSPAKLTKLDSSGTIIFSKSIPVITSGFYLGLTVNLYDNIVLNQYRLSTLSITYTTVLDNNGVVLFASSITANPVTAPALSTGIQLTQISNNNTNLYLSGIIDGTRNPAILLKLDPDNNVSVGNSYDFTTLGDAGTAITYSGTIAWSTQTPPTISTTTVTFGTTLYSVGTSSLSTSSVTPTLNSVVPFSYSIQI
jgi:hypothetical protein